MIASRRSWSIRMESTFGSGSAAGAARVPRERAAGAGKTSLLVSAGGAVFCSASTLTVDDGRGTAGVRPPGDGFRAGGPGADPGDAVAFCRVPGSGVRCGTDIIVDVAPSVPRAGGAVTGGADRYGFAVEGGDADGCGVAVTGGAGDDDAIAGGRTGNGFDSTRGLGGGVGFDSIREGGMAAADFESPRWGGGAFDSTGRWTGGRDGGFESALPTGAVDG